MEFYALNYDFNKKCLYNMNIFNNITFKESIDDAIKDYYTDGLSFEDFKQIVQNCLRYAFWSKREYELFIGDAFDKDLSNYEKIDVYSQVLPNLNILTNYILNNYKVEKN